MTTSEQKCENYAWCGVKIVKSNDLLNQFKITYQLEITCLIFI